MFKDPTLNVTVRCIQDHKDIEFFKKKLKLLQYQHVIMCIINKNKNTPTFVVLTVTHVLRYNTQTDHIQHYLFYELKT